MHIIFYLLIFFIVSIGFIMEYIKTKKSHILLGVPLMAYFFLGIPIVERLKININKTIFFIPFIVMCIRFAYVESRNTKKQT